MTHAAHASQTLTMPEAGKRLFWRGAPYADADPRALPPSTARPHKISALRRWRSRWRPPNGGQIWTVRFLSVISRA